MLRIQQTRAPAKRMKRPVWCADDPDPNMTREWNQSLQTAVRQQRLLFTLSRHSKTHCIRKLKQHFVPLKNGNSKLAYPCTCHEKSDLHFPFLFFPFLCCDVTVWSTNVSRTAPRQHTRILFDWSHSIWGCEECNAGRKTKNVGMRHVSPSCSRIKERRACWWDKAVETHRIHKIKAEV